MRLPKLHWTIWFNLFAALWCLLAAFIALLGNKMGWVTVDLILVVVNLVVARINYKVQHP